MRMLDDYTLSIDTGEQIEKRSLYIFLTRGQKNIRNWAIRNYGPFDRVVLNVDGDEHVYDADALIALLEELEVRDG